MSDDFSYISGELCAEQIPIAELAEKYGTPFYVYSHAALTRQFSSFSNAFSSVSHLVCFAMKSNSNIAILRLFSGMGGGLDIVSGGELYRAVKAGVPGERIVFAGVGKSDEEIEYALKQKVLMFNVESEEEMFNINEVAQRNSQVARVALRVNPDVDPKTHPYISTGLKKSKFGIDISKAREEYARAASFGSIELSGVHCHIGSQITTTSPFADAVEKVVELVGSLRSDGHEICFLNLGGGLGISYKDENPPHPNDYAKTIVPLIKDLGCKIIFEPGRFISGNAGVLVTRVLYKKQNPEKRFVIVDAGMNDLIRPSLYEAFQKVLPVEEQLLGTTKFLSDLVGPICESGDYLAKDREMPEFSRDNLVAVMSSGAYGFTMASNYNSRPRPPELLVQGKDSYLIRARESYEDLIRGEEIPSFLLSKE
ncbi:MAG: diaminopimelate decarboxylase [Nitrospinota bacterium]|nr:diaminopimelate decarboxylase [Nitrospinota bacterium]